MSDLIRAIASGEMKEVIYALSDQVDHAVAKDGTCICLDIHESVALINFLHNYD